MKPINTDRLVAAVFEYRHSEDRVAQGAARKIQLLDLEFDGDFDTAIYLHRSDELDRELVRRHRSRTEWMALLATRLAINAVGRELDTRPGDSPFARAVALADALAPKVSERRLVAARLSLRIEEIEAEHPLLERRRVPAAEFVSPIRIGQRGVLSYNCHFAAGRVQGRVRVHAPDQIVVHKLTGQQQQVETKTVDDAEAIIRKLIEET
jgi:hypothetical protein